MKNPTIENPRLLRGRHPCPDCGSSDSLGFYEDHFTCFGACDRTQFYEDNKGHYKPIMEEIDFEEVFETISKIQELPFRGSQRRGIYNYIYEFYGIRSTLDEMGNPDHRYYPWYSDGKLTAYKQKIDKIMDGDVVKQKKAFYMHGDTQIMNRKDCELFGQHLFSGGGRLVVITEGEDDACAIQQAYDQKYNGRRYPVVSLYNSKADQVFINNLSWITSFDKVVLWPDNDDHGAGQETMERYAKAIGTKAFIVGDHKYKDANDALRAEGHDYIISQIFNAQPYTPAGFLKGEELWSRFTKRKQTVSLPYPVCLSGINEKLRGMRSNEIVLFTSGTGTGKSTVTKEIMLHIIDSPDTRLGIVSLEEEVGETVEKFLEMSMEKNFQDDDSVTEEQQRKAFDRLFTSDRVIVLDHQGSVSDDSLIDKLRALAAMGCTHIILDHITIAVSEGNDGLTGNEAVDKMMSDLLKLVKGFPVWLGIISHLRKTGAGGKSFEEGHMPSMDDIKGSGSIKQISFDIIAFSRNMISESEEEKNTTRFRVLKARFTGNTGDAGAARYDQKTRRLKRADLSAVERTNELFSKAEPIELVDPEKAKERMGL